MNIVFWGANYYGSMAQTQRIKNLIGPLIEMSEVTVCNLLSNQTVPNINKQNKNVPAFVYRYNLINPLSFLHFLFQIRKFLKKVKVNKANNIFYCYAYPNIENILILYIARKKGYKIVFDITEDVSYADLSKSPWHVKFYHFSSLKLRKFMVKWGSACFAISQYLQNLCNDICNQRIPVYYLPICVDIPKINSYKRIPINNNITSVFYGGSFGFKDGIQYLIKGFEIAAKENSNIQLVLTGRISKQFEHVLKNLIEKSVNKSNINYLGCLPEEDFFKVMVNSDILCMNRIENEYSNAGFPFKLGEYLASGKAVLATRIEAIENYLIHEESAYLIEPESELKIAEAILNLASDVKLRKKIGEGGLKVANEYFNNYKVVEGLYKALQKI